MLNTRLVAFTKRGCVIVSHDQPEHSSVRCHSSQRPLPAHQPAFTSKPIEWLGVTSSNVTVPMSPQTMWSPDHAPLRLTMSVAVRLPWNQLVSGAVPKKV